MTSHSNCSYTIVKLVCWYKEKECMQLLLRGLPDYILQQIEVLELYSETHQLLPQQLAELIPSLNKLHVLALMGAAGGTLSKCLQELIRRDTVKRLGLHNCDATAYLLPLCQWLTTPTQLETLTISYLSSSDIETLATAAAASSLKIFRLFYSEFSLSAMKAFSAMLSKISSTTKVMLKNCVINDEAHKMLVEIKKVNTCLEVIY